MEKTGGDWEHAGCGEEKERGKKRVKKGDADSYLDGKATRG
jgi:hypothetical protein